KCFPAPKLCQFAFICQLHISVQTVVGPPIAMSSRGTQTCRQFEPSGRVPLPPPMPPGTPESSGDPGIDGTQTVYAARPFLPCSPGVYRTLGSLVSGISRGC